MGAGRAGPLKSNSRLKHSLVNRSTRPAESQTELLANYTIGCEIRRGNPPGMKSDNRGVLTVKEFADYLRVHPSTVYCRLKLGQLPALRIGRGWWFDIEIIGSPTSSRA